MTGKVGKDRQLRGHRHDGVDRRAGVLPAARGAIHPGPSLPPRTERSGLPHQAAAVRRPCGPGQGGRLSLPGGGGRLRLLRQRRLVSQAARGPCPLRGRPHLPRLRPRDPARPHLPQGTQGHGRRAGPDPGPSASRAYGTPQRPGASRGSGQYTSTCSQHACCGRESRRPWAPLETASTMPLRRWMLVKTKSIRGRTFTTRAEAKLALFEHIDGFHNTRRVPKRLGLLNARSGPASAARKGSTGEGGPAAPPRHGRRQRPETRMTMMSEPGPDAPGTSPGAEHSSGRCGTP